MAQTAEQFAARLDPRGLDSALSDLMQRMVLTVEGNVKRRTPVQTGRLRNSIASRVERAGQRGVVGTNLRYARAVHARKPFLQQGLDDSRSTLQGLLDAAGGDVWGAILK